MGRVIAPVIHDVENLGAYDSAQHHQNSKVPGMLRIDALFLGITYADPQPDQHSNGDQKAIGGKAEITKMKESGQHC